MYLDLDVINNDTDSNSEPPNLRFEEIRNAPFLDGDCDDYFCSILRFSIQTANALPIFIPRIQLGQSDPNLTVYKFTLSYKYVSGPPDSIIDWEETVQFIPRSNAPTPAPPQTKQDLSTGYYYVNSFQDFTYMLNKALDAAWKALGNSVQSALSRTDVKNAPTPFFLFDPNTNRFVVHADANLFTIDTGLPVCDLYMNSRLYELLVGIPVSHMGYAGDKNYRILFTNYDYTNITKQSYTDLVSGAPVNTTLIQVFQEISSVALWNPVSSVVFCSSMIPVHPTNISPPKVYNDRSNNNLVSGGNNAGLFNILTDFELPVSDTNQYRPNIEYSPGAEYRLLDMNSCMNLNRVDITVYWKTHYGEYIPIKLQPGCAAHLKIMFRHKSFNLSG